MIELVIAGMSGLTVLGLLRAIGPSDRITSARIRALVRPAVVPARPGLAARLGARLPGDRDQVALAMKSAGVTASADGLIALRYLGAAAGAIAGLVTGPAALVVAPLLGLVGYRLPHAYLRSRVSSNTRDVEAALPDAVELLAVCTMAGSNVSMGLARVAAATRGILGDELRRVVDAVELGATRKEAMQGLVDRYDLDDVRSFVSTLDHAERFGSGVAAALDSLANDIRVRRRREVEASARRAPVKMLFPLVLLILPAFILLTIVPLLLGTFRTLGF